MTNEQLVWVVARALQSAVPQSSPCSRQVHELAMLLRHVGVEMEVVAKTGMSPESDALRVMLRQWAGLPA